MADFDAIVVGSGCAGPAAAHELARAGKSVLVIERGNSNGSKNVSGGRLYTHALRAVFPDFKKTAPLERRIARERISLLTDDAATTLDFSDQAMREERYESYSVLRAHFDPWLAEQAENAGADYINGIAVEQLLKDGDRVTGVRAGGDEISADVVLLCDGVGSLLSHDAVGAPPLDPHQVAVGIKEVIALPRTTISDRSMCTDDEGMAWMFVGDATKGTVGGGFLYTNKESISLGLVATIGDMYGSEVPIYQMLEEFKEHPSVAPMIAGGTVVEHSGHMVAEAGFNAMPPLVADGVMLAGETALMCINAGYTVRGMDLALAAGMHAGRCAAQALDDGDTSTASLERYRQALEESFVLKDMRTLSRFPSFMESTPRVFNKYPAVARDALRTLFLSDGTPVKPLRKQMLPILREAGIRHLAIDIAKGMRAL